MEGVGDLESEIGEFVAAHRFSVEQERSRVIDGDRGVLDVAGEELGGVDGRVGGEVGEIDPGRSRVRARRGSRASVRATALRRKIPPAARTRLLMSTSAPVSVSFGVDPAEAVVAVVNAEGSQRREGSVSTGLKALRPAKAPAASKLSRTARSVASLSESAPGMPKRCAWSFGVEVSSTTA